MNLDGYYRTLISASTETYDWLRFFDDGTVLLARTGGQVETLAAWFGREDGEFSDGQGRYVESDNQIRFSIADASTTSHYTGQLINSQLHLKSQGSTQETSRIFTFFPLPKARITLAQLQVPTPKDVPDFPVPVLPPVPLAWWHLAYGKGWRCERCGKVPLLEERECWFDLGCCTDCAIESGR